MLMWIVTIMLAVAVVFLNYSGTTIVMSSNIHTDQKKRFFIALIWVIPIFGVIITMLLINRDIKKNHRKLSEEIAPVIRQLGDKIKNLEADLQQDRPNNSQSQFDKRLH